MKVTLELDDEVEGDLRVLTILNVTKVEQHTWTTSVHTDDTVTIFQLHDFKEITIT